MVKGGREVENRRKELPRLSKECRELRLTRWRGKLRRGREKRKKEEERRVEGRWGYERRSVEKFRAEEERRRTRREAS